MASVNEWGIDVEQVRHPDGRIKTSALFSDCPADTSSSEPPLYSLRSGGYKGCPSLKDIYMSIGDPTEYEFAIKALGSWEAWQRLIGENGPQWFKPHHAAWQDELEIKLRREAFLNLKELSKSKSDAAKWIAEGKWKARGPGRPTKEEKAGELRRIASVTAGLEEDAARLGLIPRASGT